jgi:hypothetical protein
MPIKPRKNEAGINVSPMRNGTLKPAKSNPTEKSMHGRGSTLSTQWIHPTMNSRGSELSALVDLKTSVWVVMCTFDTHREYQLKIGANLW